MPVPIDNHELFELHLEQLPGLNVAETGYFSTNITITMRLYFVRSKNDGPALRLPHITEQTKKLTNIRNKKTVR